MVTFTVDLYHDGYFISLKQISNDEQVDEFVQALSKNDLRLSMCTEHQGYDVLEMVQNDNLCDDTSDSDFEDVDKSEMENPIPNLHGRFMVEENDPDEKYVDPKYKVKKDFQYPSFDPDTPWNECKPVLGMRFKNPLQLKQCLANYGVTHGYQLWFMQNDSMKLFVKCGRDVDAGKYAGKRGKKQQPKDHTETSNSNGNKGKEPIGDKAKDPSNVSLATKERWKK
nr:hypothetical protein [Tanacetum cinerariifolium]